jgi:hypothetical protein
MAIIFSKDISQNKLLTAYNNNVVRFSSNTTLTPLTAQITGLGIDVLLYPHPNKSFYFNFKDYITAEINTKNFADDLIYNLVSLDPNTFTYDVSDGCYLEGVITFKINFTNNTSESTTRNLSFIAGTEQLEDYKKNEILFQSNRIIVLSPVASRTNNTTYLKYWEGYPFEFSFYNRGFPTAAFTLKNNSTGLTYDFNSKSKVTSMFLSDGRTDVTLEDFLPLVIVQNDIQFSINGVDQNINLIIDKADSDCGLYVKFLNKYGRYNYWLLSKNNYRNRSSKYLAELENDFENLEDTTSPTIQIGKVGDETIKCATDKLNENEKLIFEGIIDSPKIYLFTGERYAKADLTDWIEVRLKTNSFTVNNPKKKRYQYFVEFDLPARITQTL